MDLNSYLSLACNAGASDLHLCSAKPARIRKHGVIEILDPAPVNGEMLLKALFAKMADNNIKEYELTGQTDFSLQLPNLRRFRVSLFKQVTGVSAVLRLISTQIQSLETIGAPQVLQDILKKENGLVLVTGPTGSGKSTTLAAMLKKIYESRVCHALTIEDPIEFLHDSQTSIVNQRELGIHTKTFAGGLRSALRADPDVILIGELRDLETIQLALTASETGHFVMASLHTRSAADSVTRIVDVFPAEQQRLVRQLLGQSLQAIVAQRLLSKRQGGQVPAWEIMIATPAIRNLIRENKVAQIYAMMESGAANQMQTMEQCIKSLLQQGMITESTARKYVTDRTAGYRQ